MSASEDPVFTIPSSFYTDPDVFREDKEKIFFKTWQFVGHSNEVAEPRDYMVRNVVDQSILIVRDNDGNARAFFNVCQHRGHRLLENSGNCRAIVCPYHAWTYGLDGRLQRARNSENVSGFDLSQIRLNEVALEEFCGFLFVNLAEGVPSLGSQTGSLEDEIRSYVPYTDRLTLVGETLLEHHCNWKISVENYNECYHCAVVHKAFSKQVVALDFYRVVPDGITIRHYSRGHDSDVAMYRYDPKHGGRGEDYATWFIWPNVAINCFPGGIVSIRQFLPIDAQHTTYSYKWYRDADTPEEMVRNLMAKHAETNGVEDAEIVNSVQLGLASRGYDRGRLMIDGQQGENSEHGVAHIQSLYLGAIGATAR